MNDFGQIVEVHSETWRDPELVNVYLKNGWRLIGVFARSYNDDDGIISRHVYVLGGRDGLDRYRWEDITEEMESGAYRNLGKRIVKTDSSTASF